MIFVNLTKMCCPNQISDTDSVKNSEFALALTLRLSRMHSWAHATTLATI